MGEPVEVVEGSPDAEISRLFPKCRPRLALTPTFNSHNTQPTTSDVNRNCVSADANDNYAVPPFAPFHEPPMTSRRAHDKDHHHHNSSSSGHSSSSSSSRMSVDSAGATPTSTPVSRSSSSYSAGGGSNPTFPPTGDRIHMGCLPPDNENDDLSVVSAYLDERFSTTAQPPPPPTPSAALLDSSYEDPPPAPLGSPTSLAAPGGEAPASSVVPLVLRQHHFRLRDSRIESAGGKEVFSQSRSRPTRKRHEGDARRPHHAHSHHVHPQHHYNHHSHLHHHHHAAPTRPPAPTKQTSQSQYQVSPPGYPPTQVSADYLRKAGETSSTSRSHSSSSSGGGSSSEGGRCKDPPDEEGGTSTFVYETRLSESSEVVFDDIGEWVERGLTVREAPPVGPGAPRRSKHHQQQQFLSATPPTPPSGSDRDSEYDDVDDDDDDEDDEGEEDDETPLRITRIGGVQIAEYEGSPRRYGQPQRPARPGFPRRVGNCPAPGMVGTEERPRALLHHLEADKKGHHDGAPLHMHRVSDKTHLKKPKARLGPHHHLHHYHHSQHQNQQRLQHHQERHHPPALPPEGVKVNPSVSPSFDKGIPTAKVKDAPPAPPGAKAQEIGEAEDRQRPPSSSLDEVRSSDESGDTSSPITISISTLTSSYASSLPQMPPTTIPGPSPPPTPLEHLPLGPVEKASDLYDEYRFEDSETRKVLEEFFLEARAQQPEFFDLEYTLKRQHGNSYVGQRLAAAECEEEGTQDAEDALPPMVSEAEEDDDRREEQAGRPKSRQKQRSSCNGGGGLSSLPQLTEGLSGGQDVRGSSVNELEGGAAPPIAQENGNIPQENSEIGVSRNFTLSPETTSCDSLDVESEFSAGEGEESIPSSGKVVNTMPVLEDGLSSGEESEIEIPSEEKRNFAVEDPQESLIRAHQLLLDQHHHLYHSSGGLQLYEDGKEELAGLPGVESERERAFQRTRSLDNQLCRGELPPLNPSVMNHHIHNVGGLLAQSCAGGVSPFTQGPGGNLFPDCALPHATSSPHAKHPASVKSSATHSPSTSTLTLMKKQISEIEREIALKKPEGNLPPRKSPGEGGEAGPPNLDLHLLDPLIKKVGEPPPPPAPHPHRGNNNGLENGTPHSSPPHTSSASTSPSRVIGHLHSPQFTPVSDPVIGPKLLSTLGSLTSPGQVSPHMVPGHPDTLDLQHKQGNGVSPSRESVEAAIADIKQAIRKTKNLPLKTHPQEKQDRGPVWLPRNNRRDLPYSKKHSSSPSVQTQENSPHLQQHQDSSPSGGSNKSQDRSLHEEDGDTDQETDRLLGQQRSDDGYLEEKNWSRIRPKVVVPMTMAPNHKEGDSEGGGLNSNESTPSTPSHHGSTNLTPSSPQDLHSSNKFVGKKEKEYGKKKGRSKEVMVHEPAVLIEGVLFRARYLGSTQLVSEGQPTKTTRMMQAEEAVSRIKDTNEDWNGRRVRSVSPPSELILPMMPSPRNATPSLSLPLTTETHCDPQDVTPASENSSEALDTSRCQPELLSSRANEDGRSSSHDSDREEKPLDSSFQRVREEEGLCPSVVGLDEGEKTPPFEESLKNVLKLLDQRLDEELTVCGRDHEEPDTPDLEVLSPLMKEDYQLFPSCGGSSPLRTHTTESLDENIYVNVSNLSFEEEDAMPNSKDVSSEFLAGTLRRSYTYGEIPIVEEAVEQESDGSSPLDDRRNVPHTQGNLAWIVDSKGGVGARGNVFHIRFVGSMEVDEDPFGERGSKRPKRPRKEMVMEAVSRLKAPEGEVQPSTEVDLFISTEKIMVLNTDLKEIMMDHALRTISYIADIGDLVVLMARRRVLPTDEQSDNPSHRIPKMICHVFESDEAQFIAQSIGQAFQVAYLEFLKANGIEDHSFVKEMDYQEVLNSQEIFGDELQMFAKKELQKEVVVPKMKGEILGVVVVESGWGSMVPTVVIANLSPTGAAAKCGQLNIGDQIIAINGISLVGLPLSNCQNYIKNTKYNTAVKLTVVPCPPVVEVKIRRPDTKYQLGFSVQNGVICSLLRGGIAERGGVRVGHRIIDINSQSVVAVPHEKIVNLLATSVGEIRMKTMPTSIFRLLTGQETPQYI